MTALREVRTRLDGQTYETVKLSAIENNLTLGAFLAELVAAGIEHCEEDEGE